MDAHATTQSTSSRCSTPTTPITPTSPASSTSSSYFNSSSSSSIEPQVPFQIIVTFDGKVREMLRIEREEESSTENTIRRPRRTPRPRYYARLSEEKLGIYC